MADHTLIAQVSRTLVETIQDCIGEHATACLHDLQSSPEGPAVTLFLYEVQEDDTMMRSRGRRDASAPQLALSLAYLVTAWSDSPMVDQELLGTVLQRFHGHPMLTGLHGDFDGQSPARVALQPMSLEDKTRLWEALRQPYRASVVYNVRVTGIEPASP